MLCYDLENEPDINGQSIVSMWRESKGEKKVNNARSTKIIWDLIFGFEINFVFEFEFWI